MAENSSRSTSGDDLIAIEIPPSTRHLALVRTMAVAMAAESDTDLDQLDDLRLAVNELVSTVLDSAGPSPVRVEFRRSAGHIDVFVQPGAGTDPPEVDELAVRILQATAAHHEFATDGSATMRIDLDGG